MSYTETYKITTDIKIDGLAKESTGISFGFSFYGDAMALKNADREKFIEEIVEDATNKYKDIFIKALRNAVGD